MTEIYEPSGLPIAEFVFISTNVVRDGPPLPFRSWRTDGAILAFLHSKGVSADVFVNWVRARVRPGSGIRKPTYAPKSGYWIYYYGEPPSDRAIKELSS